MSGRGTSPLHSGIDNHHLIEEKHIELQERNPSDEGSLGEQEIKMREECGSEVEMGYGSQVFKRGGGCCGGVGRCCRWLWCCGCCGGEEMAV